MYLRNWAKSSRWIIYMLKVVHFRSTKGICESCPTLSTFLLEKEKLEKTSWVCFSICTPKCYLFSFQNFSETNFDWKVLSHHEALGALWYPGYCLFSAPVLATRTAWLCYRPSANHEKSFPLAFPHFWRGSSFSALCWFDVTKTVSLEQMLMASRHPIRRQCWLIWPWN